MLSVVIHMEVLGLNELIVLASGVLSNQAFAWENMERRIQTICFPDETEMGDACRGAGSRGTVYIVRCMRLL